MKFIEVETMTQAEPPSDATHPGSGQFDMFELSRMMGHASQSITDRVYGHLRKKDNSYKRARFTAFLQAAAAPVLPPVTQPQASGAAQAHR